MSDQDKRLIEDYLPIKAIQREHTSASGHINTLHLWWARRPLLACRAAVYSALVPVSRFVPNGASTEKRKSLGRANAAKFVERLCQYPADSKTIAEARANPPDLVGPGYYALMRLDEFVASRVVEAVVHGFDLTDALGLDELASDDAVAIAAEILDELLARRTVAGRPADLSDDRAWVRAASGRAEHEDPRLPLIG